VKRSDAKNLAFRGYRQMPTIEDTLKRLAITFTAKDIMIPEEGLTCAGDRIEAARVSKENPDFSVIPLRRNAKLSGYFLRDSQTTREIVLSDLISDGTSLLDLVEIFEDREFSFVLTHREIAGYVHFSDLNHHLVKLTFYVILEALERHALSSTPQKNDREYLSKNLDPSRFTQIDKQYKRDGDAARSLFNYLNISDILRLAVKAGSIQLDDHVIKTTKEIRDGAAHASENIVADFESVKKLAIVKRECLRILGGA
jgi:hypothetical protein